MLAFPRRACCLLMVLASLWRGAPARAEVVAFDVGSYIVPMDTTYQDNGMLRAYGLLYRLLRAGVPVQWVIEPTKAHGGVDFTASARDHRTAAAVTAYGYRGGPFVIGTADVAAALPIVDAWQALYPQVAVHEATASFSGFVAKHLIAAPTIAVFADGNETIEFGYMNAAGIPDSAGNPWPTARVTCPSTRPDVMCPEQVAGSDSSHSDGTLFDAYGTPVYCQMMSMHWGVADARRALGEEVILEYRSFLMYPTHLFAECQAVNAIENSVNAHFLTTTGYAIDGRPSTYTYFHDDLAYAQIDGAFLSVGGSEPSYSIPAGGAYRATDTVMVTAAGSPVGTRDVWMTGYVDGTCPIGVECPGAHGELGKVSYLGGHQYPTSLPISGNPSTNGVRYFLNALFEASCATAEGQPMMVVTKRAPDVAVTDTVTYYLDFVNGGTGVATNLVLSDPIPAGSTFDSADSGGTFDGSAVTWNLRALAAADSGSVSFTVRLGAAGHYTNRATLTFFGGTTPRSTTSNTTDTAYGLDQDTDGLTDADEVALGTDPHDCDTDDDGVSDGDEVHVFGTNPVFADTDGDGLQDGTELGYVRDCPASCHTPARCACAATATWFVPDTDCTTTTDPLDPFDPPRCGDARCNGAETCSTCPADCGTCPPPPPTCTDGTCNGTETCTSCPADCGACPPVCGDGTCNGTETCVTCAGDCGACPPWCGDGTCNGGETCTTCALDCGACPPVCGDGTCDGTETCTDCPGDCGVCPPVCGDGTCNGTETCSSCATDCGACPPVCGDGTCNGTETCSSCATDCGACAGTCGDGSCDSGETCAACPADCGGCVGCGDRVCESDESCTSCPDDCGDCPGACGDEVCDSTEMCVTCTADCGACSTTCGDGVCSSDETCATCAAECGACDPSCGNGVCEPGESCATCGTDCGTCTGTCGDSVCDWTETCASCALDCGTCRTCGDGTCSATESCTSCPDDCGECPATCGDGTCDDGEDCASCPSDCACPDGGDAGDGDVAGDGDDADDGDVTGDGDDADDGDVTGDSADADDDDVTGDGADARDGDARDGDLDGGDVTGDGVAADDDDGGPHMSGSGGCGCAVPAPLVPHPWLLLLGLAVIARRRRRR